MLETILPFRDENLPRMKRASATTLMLLAVILSILSGIINPYILRVIFAIPASALYASAIFARREKWMLIFAVIPAAIVAVATGDITGAVSSLLLPASLAVSAVNAVYMRRSKAASVIVSIFALAAASAICLAVFLLTGGELPSLSSFSENVRQITSKLVSVNSDNAQNSSSDVYKTLIVDELVKYISMSIPSIVSGVLFFSSYISLTLTSSLLSLFSFRDRVAHQTRSYEPSAISAFVYILSYIVSASLAGNSRADIVGYSAENILLIFLPPMMIYGEKVLYNLSISHDRRTMFTVLSLFAIFSLPSLYFMTVSFTGAISLLYFSLKPTLQKFWSSFTNGGNGEDDG